MTNLALFRDPAAIYNGDAVSLCGPELFYMNGGPRHCNLPPYSLPPPSLPPTHSHLQVLSARPR